MDPSLVMSEIEATDDAMSSGPTQAEQDADYVRQRRLDLTMNFALLTTIIVGFGFGILFVYDLLFLNMAVWYPIELTVGILFVTLPLLGITSILLARRSHSFLAIIALMASLTPAVFALQLIIVMNNGDITTVIYFFSLYTLVIVIAGTIGGQQVTIIMTAITTVLAAIICFMVPSHFAVLLIFFGVMIQMWGTAVAVYLAAANYARTLADLSAARLEYERVKQIDDMKAQFITSVNHELRNPIMAMLGYLELLLIPRNRNTPDRLDYLVGEANRAGQNLRALLNSILAARRIDRGAAEFTPSIVNVRDAVEGAMRLIDPREAVMTGRDLRVRVPTNLEIWGDPVHLQQILMNLISNAIKYSAAGTPVDVTALRVIETQYEEIRWRRRMAHVSDMIEIVVHDYGLGIPAEQVPLLFQRFSRLPRDLASKVIGNGLGLFLCRVLTEAMGGRLWVESQGIAGKGSTFHVRLPLPPQDALAAKNTAPPVPIAVPVAATPMQLAPTARLSTNTRPRDRASNVTQKREL